MTDEEIRKSRCTSILKICFAYGFAVLWLYINEYVRFRSIEALILSVVVIALAMIIFSYSAINQYSKIINHYPKKRSWTDVVLFCTASISFVIPLCILLMMAFKILAVIEFNSTGKVVL